MRDKDRLGFVLLLVLSVALTACSKSSSSLSADPPTAANLSVSFSLKTLQFSWTPATGGVTSYKLVESPDGAMPYVQVGGALPASATTVSVPATVYAVNWAKVKFGLDACNAGGCTRSNLVSPASGMLQTIGYFKASNTAPSAFFGTAVALSSDGNTMAVGAFGESSSATGISGNQADQSDSFAGAVYVFTNASGQWSQQAYIKPAHTAANDFFGHTLAISSDGNTLAIGSLNESSAATGVNGNEADTTAPGAGAVYVFTRSGINWSQQAYLKASNTAAASSFGLSVSLSSDGNTLAAGAPFESSGATGINGNQSDVSAPDAGAVYIFTRAVGAWTQQAYVKASNAEAHDDFGFSTALSGDGNTLAVGATGEASSATGVGGNQADDADQNAGAAYVFTRSRGAWAQQSYVKASNTNAGDEFGYFVDLSSNGTTLAVGAPIESSIAIGVNGNQIDNSSPSAGAVYVFARGSNNWSQQAYLKPSNTGLGYFFGISTAMTFDGNTLAVGAEGEASSGTGINGNEADHSDPNAGAVYVFTRSGTTWSQEAYVKAPNTGAGDSFGFSVALSSTGTTLAVGAPNESSSATGIDGNQSNDSDSSAGAVYLY